MLDWNAIDFGSVAQGVIYITCLVLAALGLRKGASTSGQPRASSVEVAGALVDSEAVKYLSGEVAGQSIAITAQTAALKEQTIATREHTKALEEQTRALLTLEKEIEEHRHEMSRRR